MVSETATRDEPVTLADAEEAVRLARYPWSRPCVCGHSAGSHSRGAGHCCATAGAGPRSVTGTCRCRAYSPEGARDA
jgi:hypothetical protein